ncbi:MAG: hypothetical protein KGL39_57270, partial [Patescibacteria group bacterium]|nr:hypothetical protein [Patescibacteria group bacterium]
MTVHIHAPPPIKEDHEVLDNVPVQVGYSRYRHRGLEVYKYFYEWYDPSFVVVTACGLGNHLWRQCTMRKRPCKKCYPE